jgi:hypothetical protein
MDTSGAPVIHQLQTPALALDAITALVLLALSEHGTAAAPPKASASVSVSAASAAGGPTHNTHVLVAWSPTAQGFAQTLCRLETAKSVWTAVHEWHQAIDRYYTLPSGRIVRTTTTSVNGALGVTHMHDACMAAAVLGTAGTTGDTVRASTHRTRAVATAELQDRVDSTKHTCLRQVRSFTKQSAGTGIVWQVEACQIWEGAQLTQALMALRDGEPPRTVITLAAHGIPAAVHTHGMDRVVASVMFKIADVFRLWAPEPACLVRGPDAPRALSLQTTTQGKTVVGGGSCAAHWVAHWAPVATPPVAPEGAPTNAAAPAKGGRANSKAAAAAALLVAKENAVAHAFGHPYNHFA